MTRSTLWRTLFLGLTVVVLGMEVWASFDGDDATDPWTALIVRHIPGEITALLIAGLCGWLIVHFARRYWRKEKPTVGQKPTVEEGDVDESQDR